MAKFKYLVSGYIEGCDSALLSEGQIAIFKLVPNENIPNYPTTIDMVMDGVEKVYHEGQTLNQYVFDYDESLVSPIDLKFCDIVGLPTCKTCCQRNADEIQSLKAEIEDVKSRILLLETP